MTDESYEPNGTEFDEAPFIDSDESGGNEDDGEFDDEEEEDEQSVD